jgi:hypothetical protein
MHDFIAKLIKDTNEVNQVIATLAGVTRDVELSVLADALGQFQNAVFAEIYKQGEDKYKAKSEAERAFGSVN